MTKNNASLLKRIIVSSWLLIWVFLGFYITQFGLAWLIKGVVAVWTALSLPSVTIDITMATTAISVLIYGVCLAITIGIPAWWLKLPTTKKELGIEQTVPKIRDIGLAPLVLFVCTVLSIIGIFIASALFSGFNPEQVQSIPFEVAADYSYLQLVFIFLTLVILAPVAEELLLRGYLYGKLRHYAPAWITILATALLFGALHLGLGSLESLQWNVFIMTFTLALGLGWLREYTKSVWSGIIVHMIKNFIAFLFLFIFTQLVSGVL